MGFLSDCHRHPVGLLGVCHRMLLGFCRIAVDILLDGHASPLNPHRVPAGSPYLPESGLRTFFGRWSRSPEWTKYFARFQFPLGHFKLCETD